MTTVWFFGMLVMGAVYAVLFGRLWETQKEEALIRKSLLGFYQRTVSARAVLNRFPVWQLAKQLDLPPTTCWMIGWLTAALAFGVSYFFLESFLFAIPIAGLLGVFAVIAWIRWHFSRRQTMLRDVFLDEVIPLGIQALGAMNELGAFFPIAAESIDQPIVKRFFLSLHQSWRTRGMTAEEAFYTELKKWSIPELEQLGAITLLSVNRRVELSNIWLEYHTLITNDLHRKKEASAKTYGARNSALAFVLLVGGMFLLGAKIAAPWITPTITQSLYVIFTILALAAWWIWKQKDAIDV